MVAVALCASSVGISQVVAYDFACVVNVGVHNLLLCEVAPCGCSYDYIYVVCGCPLCFNLYLIAYVVYDCKCGACCT